MPHSFSLRYKSQMYNPPILPISIKASLIVKKGLNSLIIATKGKAIISMVISKGNKHSLLSLILMAVHPSSEIWFICLIIKLVGFNLIDI